jgi:hypothetical protein
MMSVGATAAQAVTPYSCTTEQALSTQVARVGQTVTAVLTCFDAGEVITGSLFSAPQQVFSVTADANGSATAPFVIPNTACGLHTVVANGQTSGKQSATPLRIVGCGGHHHRHHGSQFCRDWRDPGYWIEHCDTEDHHGWDDGFDAAYSAPLAAGHTSHSSAIGVAGLGMVAPLLLGGSVMIARRRKRA